MTRALLIRSVSYACVLFVVGCSAPSEPEDAAALPDANPHCAVAADCDDGLYCTGIEACRPTDVGADGHGCVQGDPPCAPGMTCDEPGRICAGACTTDSDGDGAAATSCGGTDCDDGNALVHPGATEVCDAANVDEDCDASTYGSRDRDGDHENDGTCCNGLTCGTDCDDTAPGTNPTAPEVCDGRDNDCDAAIDEGTTVACYVDADGDGFAASGALSSLQCDCPPRTTPTPPTGTAIDCNDSVGSGAGVSPTSPEVCNYLDDNCDGQDDEGLLVPCFLDADGDHYAPMGATAMMLCSCGVGLTVMPPSIGSVDCNDAIATQSPIGVEGCSPDAIDQDCDGTIDETATRWYPDCDHDGYGAGTGVSACANPGVPPSCAGGTYSTLQGDCNDSNPLQKPMLPDLCNAFDDDCDASTPNGSGERTSGGALVLGTPCDDADDADLCTANGATVCTGTLTCMETAPNRVEQCNGTDDDCDTTVDEASAANAWCAANLASVPHATATTCSGGTCVPTGCQAGWNDCSSAPGCEIACQWRGCNGAACADPTRVTYSVDSGGTRFGCASRAGGGVACWNGSGTPVVVAGITNATDVDRNCVLRSDGTVVVLGTGFAAGAPVSGVTTATQIACGGSGNVSCAVLADRRVACFNANGAIGLLGNGTTSGSFGMVSGLSDAVQVAVGTTHACARRATGGVVCWGLNNFGQLGDGVATHGTCMYGTEPYDCATTPVAVSGITDAIDIAAGYLHSCALRATGDVMCWGLGNALGDGITHGSCPGWLSSPMPPDCSRVPVRAPASPATSIDAADYLSGMGLTRAGGALASWSQGDSLVRDAGSTSPSDYAVAGNLYVTTICAIDSMGLRCSGMSGLTRVPSP